MTTLTWDAFPQAWDIATFDWEGNDISAASGAYQFFVATSTFDPTMVATGSLASFAATNTLLEYTATGVVED